MAKIKSSVKKYIFDYAPLFVVAGLVITLDQLTKSIVRSQLTIGEIWTPWEWLEPYARIVHWKNTGAAFGILQGFSDVFTVLAIIVAIAILYYYPRVPRDESWLRFAMGLQLGGAMGNLIDRLTIGWVTDYVSIGNLPVFNVADFSITTGTAVLVLGIWINEQKQESSKAPPGEETKPETISEPLPEETWGE